MVKKYSEVIDRESAYEILNKKIAATEEETAQKENQKKESRTSTRSSRQEPTASEVIGKSVLKVLTSATFIRGAFGILSKVLKK